MSLYFTQKLLYELNRSPAQQARYRAERDVLLTDYALSDEERQAFRDEDIGLLYVLGVNGQILMHYAAFLGIEWNDYLTRMRAGVARHGPVRAGVYAMTTARNVTDDAAGGVWRGGAERRPEGHVERHAQGCAGAEVHVETGRAR